MGFRWVYSTSRTQPELSWTKYIWIMNKFLLYIFFIGLPNENDDGWWSEIFFIHYTVFMLLYSMCQTTVNFAFKKQNRNLHNLNLIWICTGCCVGMCKVFAASCWSYLMDVNKLEMLLKCPMSADVQHSVSLLAKCLCYILTSNDHCASTVVGSDGYESSEVSRTVDMFMAAHSTWLTQQLQHITDYIDSK